MQIQVSGQCYRCQIGSRPNMKVQKNFYALDTVSSLIISGRLGNHHLYPLGRRVGERASPSMVFKPEFFDYPGLKDILSAISESKKNDDDVEAVPKKREVNKDNMASFSLRVNPVIPRNPLSVKSYSKECQERRAWCAEIPSPKPKVCPPADTPTPRPVTCGPTKPQSQENKMYIYCNYAKSKPPIYNDPCDECPTMYPFTTQYVACYSMPPPTAFARMRHCNPTTKPCHVQPCTYKQYEPLSTEPPPTPPRCDIGSLEALRQPESRYYILVKRSPGSWRSKRSRPRRRFRIVSEQWKG